MSTAGKPSDQLISPANLHRIQLIDDLLPQTQCGQCGFVEGCRPYAEAMVLSAEPANLCVPGGQPLADQLSSLLGQPRKPTAPSRWQLDPATERPVEVEAVINESLCIGCYKCVTACPVDAIVGAAKLMHTVIASDCTGCELCLEPCPVDCIDLVAVGTQKLSNPQLRERFKIRYQRHQARLNSQEAQAKGSAPLVSAKQTQANSISPPIALSASSAKERIEAAKLRTQLAKLKRQQAALLDSEPSQISPPAAKLESLNAEIEALKTRLGDQPTQSSPATQPL